MHVEQNVLGDSNAIVEVEKDGSYSLKGDFNYLAVGETATVTFKYTANDGTSDADGEPNVSEPATVTLTIVGTNDAPSFTSDGGTDVFFTSENAGYDNVLIAYTLGEDGKPENPILVVASSKGGHSDGDLMAELDASIDDIHFAIISKGHSVYESITNLEFDNSGEYPILKVNGSNSTAHVYFDITKFNSTGLDHFDVTDNGDGTFTVGMEDQGLGDNDRVDLVVKLVGDSTEGQVKELLEEDESANAILSSSGTITFDDPDLTDTHTVSVISNTTGFLGTLTSSVNTNATGTGKGQILWNFEVSDKAVDYLADGETVTQVYTIEVNDGHGGSDTQEITITITGTNDTPTITENQVFTVNETLFDIGKVLADDSDVGDTLTYSLASDSNIFKIDSSTGVISTIGDKSLNFADASSYDLEVKVTDSKGAYDIKNVVINVNDITGKVTGGFETLVEHNFDVKNNEGWAGNGDESYFSNRYHLGWFNKDSDYRSHDFNLDAQAGQEVSVSFDLSTSYYWDNDDAFIIKVVDSNGKEICSETIYSQDKLDNVSFDIKVPMNGDFTVTLQSHDTSNYESWMIDNFKIITQSDEVLTFETPVSGEINLAGLLEQGENFGSGNQVPDSLDEINLSRTSINLVGITAEDIFGVTDSDNTLKITGDNSSSVTLQTDNTLDDIGWTQTGTDTGVFQSVYDGNTITLEIVDNTINEII